MSNSDFNETLCETYSLHEETKKISVAAKEQFEGVKSSLNIGHFV